MKKDSIIQPEENISRKEALKKAGKYAAFTAAASLMLISPKQALALSNNGDPLINRTGQGWGTGTYTPTNRTPFDIPEDKKSNSGLRETPWK